MTLGSAPSATPTPTQLGRRAAMQYFLVTEILGRSGIAPGQGASSSVGTPTRPSSTASPTKAPSSSADQSATPDWSAVTSLVSLACLRAPAAIAPRSPLAPHAERPGVRTYSRPVSYALFEQLSRFQRRRPQLRREGLCPAEDPRTSRRALGSATVSARRANCTNGTSYSLRSSSTRLTSSR